MILMLFFAILLTPLFFVLGIVLWLIGVIQKGDSERDTPIQLAGKKMMWGAVLFFLVGMGSCWGLIGLESVFSQFLG